jgi:hypothetical protein
MGMVESKINIEGECLRLHAKWIDYDTRKYPSEK